jgi:hypothetical protein
MSTLNNEQLEELSDEELEAEFNKIKQESLSLDEKESNEEQDHDEPLDESNDVQDETTDSDDDADEPEEESELSLDEVDEGKEETSSEDEGQPDGEPASDEDDTKSEPTETLKLKPLKVDGKELPINSLDELYTMASAGTKFTQKMQAISKYKKAYMIMDKQGLTDEDISLLAEAKTGNKDAIATLIKQAGIDPLELDDGPSENYTPGAFIPSDAVVQIEEIQKELSAEPEVYQNTVRVVNDILDERSQEMLVQNPNLIRGIHEDIKSGAFQYVMAEAEKLKLMDGASKPDFEYYLIAATQGSNQEVQNQGYVSPEQQQERVQKSTKPTVSKARRRAAGSSKARTPAKSGPIDWDEISDEELMAKREEILSRY